MRGMNVVGYCENNKCVNFERWICVSLGYGRYIKLTRFTNEQVSRVARCELCPRKDMIKFAYRIVGMFFKECVWRVEKAETMLQRPNPAELEAWRGKETTVGWNYDRRT